MLQSMGSQRVRLAQARIKIAKRNINNLKYADDTIFMAESEEELKSLLMKVCMHAQSLQLCLTLCDPMDCSLPGSSVHGVLQARTGVVSHSLLQGIFPTHGWNPCPLHLVTSW